MKKIIFVIPITILFILLSKTFTCKASTLNQLIADQGRQNIFVLFESNGTYQVICDYYEPNYKYMRILPGLSIGLYDSNWGDYSNCDVFYANTNNPLENPDFDMTGFSTSTPLGNYITIVCVKGSAHDDSNSENQYFASEEDYNDYINPSPEPTWFEIWSNRVNEFLNDWLPWAVDLDHAFDDLTIWLFGMELDGDDVQYGNDIEYFDFPSPTPFPTQTPYQEQIVPDGNGGFTVQYVYINPSGTPITATAPPPEPTYTIQITDSPQYDISGVPVPPADGLQDAIDAIDDNIEDFEDGFEAIHGSFSVLPIKWFFFFGVPAAIILIGGIIRSLLGG